MVWPREVDEGRGLGGAVGDPVWRWSFLGATGRCLGSMRPIAATTLPRR